MFTSTTVMDHTQKRRPTIAKEWQLAVLKKLQSESSNPTEGQRSAAAAETGLDEKWVRNWFMRQRSKVAARNRKGQPTTVEPHQPRARSAIVPTFKLQLCHPPTAPSGPEGLPSHRPVSMPIDPGPYPPTSPRQPSPASHESRSPHPSRSNVNAQAISRSHRSIPVPTYLNDPHQSPALVLHTATIPTYSRDPLYNRYPDFSQFFHPQVHERFRSSEFSAQISIDTQLLVNPNMDSHAPTYFQGLFNLLDPHHLGSFPGYQSSSTNLRSCPVAFSMRLVDLLGHP